MSAAPSVSRNAQRKTDSTTVEGPHIDNTSPAREPNRRAKRRNRSHAPLIAKRLRTPVPARAYYSVRKTSSSTAAMSRAPPDVSNSDRTAVSKINAA